MTSTPQGPKPRISIIVAMAKNRVIGADNKLPWHLSADLKRFKALTMGHHIIMGRKTFESIGKPLPGRTTLIISRDTGYEAPGAKVVHSLPAALSASAADSEVFIIGGEQIFREALPLADRIYLTEIDKDFSGDTWFPAFSQTCWRTAHDDLHVDEKSGLRYRHQILERVAPASC